MPTPIQLSPFENPTIYDAPELLISQVFDNEVTMRGVVDTVLRPQNLTIPEREGIASRMKQALGNRGITNAMADIVTNPWVWLMFVTSPAAGTILRQGTRGVFSGASQISAWARERTPFLATFGGLTALQHFDHTPITPGIMQFSRRQSELRSQMIEIINTPMQQFLETQAARGVHLTKGLDPDNYAKGSDAAEVAGRVSDALAGSLEGMDRDVLKRTVEVTMNGVEEKLTNVRRLVNADLDQVLASEGALELRDAFKKATLLRYHQLFGKDKGFGDLAAMDLKTLRESFEPDDEKAKKIWEGLRLMQTSDGLKSLDPAQGREAVAKLLGAEMEQLMSAGTITLEEVKTAINKAITVPLQNDLYLPHNIRDHLGSALSPLDIAAFRDSHRFVATGSSIFRMKGRPFSFHPEDLERMKQRFGGTESIDEKITELRELETRLNDAGEVMPVFRLSFVPQMDMHFKHTAESVGFYVDPLDDIIKIMRNDALPGVQEPLKKQVHKNLGFGEEGPRNIAELLAEGVAFTTDPHSRKLLTTVIVPRITGRLNTTNATLLATQLNAKAGLGAFLKTRAGDAIRKSGQWGEKLYGRLEQLSDPNLVPAMRDRETVSKFMTRYLYVTHLGLNLSSILINLTQPLLHAATYGGVNNVLKSYVKAVGELGGYVSERVARYGIRPLAQGDRAALIRKHFKYADITDIEPNIAETIDAVTFSPGSVGNIGRRESLFLDYPMKLFEKAEWLNRTVAAHTMENAYRAAGRYTDDVASPEYARRIFDTQRLVQETQFGGSLLNTPTGFLHGVLSNGLMRQFLTFPWRSFTTTVYTSPFIINSRGKPFASFANDFFRGMGLSAVVYEMGKGLAGIDLSRGLFGSAVTDIVGGERFLEDGNQWVPVPPILDIPIDLIQGMANDDMDLLRSTWPRILPPPLNIPFARLLGVAPQQTFDPLRGLQKEFVDWDNPLPDGQVAVFKPDGTLVGYERPSTLVLRGLGADLGAGRQGADLDHYLVTQREQIVGMRQEMLRRILANDVAGAQRIRTEFHRRYGYELRVTAEQLRAAIELRRVPRTERILDRIAPQDRPAYQALVAETRAAHIGLSPEVIRAGATAKQRATMGTRHTPETSLSPEALGLLRRVVQEEMAQAEALRGGALRGRPVTPQQEGAAAGGGGFTPFTL